MNADTRKAEWLQSRRKFWSGFTGLTNRMIDSEAFQALRSVHSVKVLIYFWQKAEYAKEKRKPGHESFIGNLTKIRNQGEMSFEYRIAGYRGMRPDQFSKALKELFQHGFIDISQPGRGVKGEYTKFAISTRWMKYGTIEWQEIPFPPCYRAGFTSEEYKRKRREGREREEDRYGKPELITTESRSYSDPDPPLRLRKRVVKNDRIRPPATTQTRSLLTSFHALKDSEGDQREGLNPDMESKGSSAPTRTRLPFTKPKVLECQLSSEQMDDYLREVEGVRSWT